MKDDVFKCFCSRWIYRCTYDHEEQPPPLHVNVIVISVMPQLTVKQSKIGWENGDTAMRKFHGGHLIHDAKQKKYYIEREQAPLDQAPDGIPTLSDWKLRTNSFGGGVVDGSVNGALLELKNGMKDGNQNQVVVNNVITKANDVEYGNVIEDASGNKFYLRDDIAYRDATAMPNAPKGVPTLKDVMIIGTRLFARIFNDAYDGNKNGEYIEIKMGWENGDTAMRKFHGGHLIHDAKQKKYYIEREQESWPPHVSPKTARNARTRLPIVGD
eukprot:scaffold2302_cov243-Alexandrium_tamarense.AAC.1